MDVNNKILLKKQHNTTPGILNDAQNLFSKIYFNQSISSLHFTQAYNNITLLISLFGKILCSKDWISFSSILLEY